MSGKRWWQFWKKDARPRRRRFKAAKSSNLVFGFDSWPRTMDQDLSSDLPVLIARARALAKDDDYVRKYMRIARTNIVGQRGIELRANYTDGGSPNKGAIAAVEAAWKQWGEAPEVSGRLNWVDCQNLAVDHLARDGEILIAYHQRGAFGFQIQFMDPMSLAHRLNYRVSDTREIIMGVELDTRLRFPTAYYFATQEDNQPDTFSFDGHRFVRVPADRILHIYRQEEVHQTRGFSPLSSAIQRLKMLNGYEDAALTAARAGAAKMAFLEQAGDIPYEGDEEDADEGMVEEFEPGYIGKLPMGYKLAAFDTGYPNIEHGQFVKAIIRGIASGIGVSYNTLAEDLEGVNFSSMRSGKLDERDEWMNSQRFVASKMSQPVFEEFLGSALTLRLIMNKSQPYNPDRFEQFRKVNWQGRRWPWVDPQKDIEANAKAIDYGLRSPSDVIREQGRDPDEVFAEIASDRDAMQELGIEVHRNDGNSSPASDATDAEG